MSLSRALGCLAALLFAGSAGAASWPDASFHVERDLSSPDPGVRRAAADRLRTLPPKVASPLLLRALGDPDVDVRVAAAHAAVAQHATEAGHPMVEWLTERDPRLRVAACEVLAELRDPGDVAPLARALGDSEPAVRAAAAAALGRESAREATPPLLGKLDDASPVVRVEVVVALARLGDPRAVVPLVGKAQDSVPEVRQAVARALGELGDPRATPALVLSLRDATSEVRAASVVALGQLRAERAADAIAPLATDRNPLLRRVAVEALGRIGSTDAVRALLGLLGAADDANAGLEASPPREALVRAGPACVPLLRGLLAGSATPAAATSAAWVLGELRASAAIPDLVRAMRRGTLPTASALHSLAAIGDEAAVPVVLEFVGDESASVRREALRATERLLDPAHPDGRAVEPLASALRDTTLTGPERALAVALLGRTGAPRAAPVIEALLSARDPELKLAAVDALGALGPTGADLSLLREIVDPDPGVRLHVAVAVGRAGGPVARDALLSAIDSAEAPASGPPPPEVDPSTALAAIGALMARVPSEGAVAALRRGLLLASGPERDGFILAIGRADVPAARPVLREIAASPGAEDRRTLATALAARRPSPDTIEMLGALLSDGEASVRAEAAWSLGEVGGPGAVPALQQVFASADPAPAIDAAAAIARIAARAHGSGAASLLCPLLQDSRPYVRANAAAGLALSGARCQDGALERRLLREDVASVRAGAARAIAGAPSGAEDARALERCRGADASGAVARLCRGPRGATRPPPATPAVEPVEIYVEGDAGAPQPGEPYVLAFADGLLRAGKCDRRGATFDAAAPRGEVSLLRLTVER